MITVYAKHFKPNNYLNVYVYYFQVYLTLLLHNNKTKESL